jgi:hypothetical protein
MNDTKWRLVFDVITSHKIHCRVKLLYHDYADEKSPGAAVITGYSYERIEGMGTPDMLSPQPLFSPANGCWEASRIGPFQPSEVEWVSIDDESFHSIIHLLPKNLKLVHRDRQTVVIGYELDWPP